MSLVPGAYALGGGGGSDICTGKKLGLVGGVVRLWVLGNTSVHQSGGGGWGGDRANVRFKTTKVAMTCDVKNLASGTRPGLVNA